MKRPHFSLLLSRRGGRLWGILEAVFFLLLVLFLLGALRKLMWVKPPDQFIGGEAEDRAGSSVLPARLNILCLGIDSVEGTHRTDTILLVGVDPGDGRIEVVSIPRDTRVTIDGHARKINEIVARHGVQALRTLIEELMEIRVDRHVMVDFQGFVKIIDLIGGVEVDVETRMKYTDNWQKLYIDLMPGLQRLDGPKALQYVRFRADAAADLGRIKRQQKFLAALLNQVKSPGIVVKIPDLVRQALGHIDTDLNVAEVVDLAMSMLRGQMRIHTQSLPGDARYIDRVSYFLPYKDQAVALGSQGFSSLVSLELDAGYALSQGPASAAPVIEQATRPISLPVTHPATEGVAVPVSSLPASISVSFVPAVQASATVVAAVSGLATPTMTASSAPPSELIASLTVHSASPASEVATSAVALSPASATIPGSGSSGIHP